MSGLLVKSTVVMKENLEELNSRGVAARWPVLLGGAALTRAYVENDLAEVYEGEVRYARDAFEGLRLMDAVARPVQPRRCRGAEALPALRKRRVRARPRRGRRRRARATRRPLRRRHRQRQCRRRRSGATRVVKGIALADYAAYLDERATFLGQWGLKGAARRRPVVRGAGRDRGPAAAADVAGPDPDREPARGGRRLRLLPLRTARATTSSSCDDEGRRRGEERARFTFPRQRRDRRLCLADFFRPQGGSSGGARRRSRFHLVTMGSQGRRGDGGAVRRQRLPRLPRAARPVGAADRGAGRVLARPGPRGARASAPTTTPTLDAILRQGYRGSRYSFGYPACPDLEDRAKLVELLDPERIGVTLSEELQLHPEQSTDALVVHHPEAKYFNAT